MNELKSTSYYYLGKALPFLLLVFSPVLGAMIVIFALCLTDMILGMWAAAKEGYKLTSRSMRRTIPKLLVYEFTVAFFFLIELYLFHSEGTPVTKGVTAIIGAIEGKSLFENLYRITKVDFVKMVIDKLQLLNKVHANDKDKEAVHQGKDSLPKD